MRAGSFAMFLNMEAIMTHKHKVLAITGAVVLLLFTAGASAYVTQKMADAPETTAAKTAPASGERITWNEPRQAAPQPQAQVQPAKPACDDGNIVGAAIGAVGGGLVGSQIGSGKGQDLATIGGAIGGGWLGKDHIPTRNVLCP